MNVVQLSQYHTPIIRSGGGWQDKVVQLSQYHTNSRISAWPVTQASTNPTQNTQQAFCQTPCVQEVQEEKGEERDANQQAWEQLGRSTRSNCEKIHAITCAGDVVVVAAGEQLRRRLAECHQGARSSTTGAPRPRGLPAASDKALGLLTTPRIPCPRLHRLLAQRPSRTPGLGFAAASRSGPEWRGTGGDTV
jgi:hypothetical protein